MRTRTIASPIRLLRNAVALGVLAVMALLWPVAFAAGASCAEQPKVMSCCAESPADCASLPEPCCKLTQPAPASPALLTAQPAPQTLCVSGTHASAPALIAPAAGSHRPVSSQRARSSPLFIAHAALLI